MGSLDRIDDLAMLVDRLDYKAARSFFSDLSHGGNTPAAGRQVQLRQLLVQRLNRNRRQHARRGFHAFFDPFVSNDDWIAGATFPVPGLVLRAHVGALWLLAERAVCSDLVGRLAVILDLLVVRMPVEDALQDNEAARILEAIGLRVAKFLDHALADRGRLNEALSGFRKACAEIDASMSLRHIDADLLQLLATILKGGKKASAIVAIVDALPVNGGEGEIQRAMQDLVKAQDRLEPAFAAILPAMSLHRRGAAAVCSAWLRRRPNHAAAGPAIEAMLGHYSASTRLLVASMHRLMEESFGGTVAASEVQPILARGGGLLPDDSELMQRIDLGLDRYGAVLDAMTAAGLTEARRTEALFRDPWAELLSAMTQFAAPLARARLLSGAESPRQPTDLASAMWLGRVVSRWRRILIGFGYSADGMADWCEGLGGQLGQVLGRVGRRERTPDDMARFQHLLRVMRIACELDVDIFGEVSASNRGIMGAIQARLKKGGPFDDIEQAFMSRFARIVMLDMERIRNWKSPDHVALVEAVQAAGIPLG